VRPAGGEGRYKKEAEKRKKRQERRRRNIGDLQHIERKLCF
jgi:hypothetical protein